MKKIYILTAVLFLQSLHLFSSDSEHSTASLFNYIKCDENGIITITQPFYPIHQTAQNLMPLYRQTGPAVITLNPDGTYSAMIPTERYPEGSLFDPLPAQVHLMESVYETFTCEHSTQWPHFSDGQLVLNFSTLPMGTQKFSGRAVAIDRNLLITQAHHFLPKSIDNQDNHERVRATTVVLDHLLVDSGEPNWKYPSTLISHCYIHPEWERNFDPHYDVALVFLTRYTTFTEEEYNKLLKKPILLDEIRGLIKVVNDPHNRSEIKESVGKLWGGDRVARVIYHRANTEYGSSGSAILNDRTMIGVHADGSTSEKDHKNGIRIRHDLLPFIEESIRLNQLFLKDEEKGIEEKKKMLDRYEEERAQKHRDEGKLEGRLEGIVEGEIKGKLETARNLKVMGLSLDQISTATGLSLEDLASHGIT